MLAKMETDSVIAATEAQLRALSGRIAELGDADLRLRTQAACDMSTRLIRALAQDTRLTSKLIKPTQKFTEILEGEISRLEDSWEGEDYLFARRRYVAKLEVLSESY